MDLGFGFKALMAIVLIMGLMAALGEGSAGSRPGMDTDLGITSASFLGDNASDWFGHSVACAGDVNGDGYDDILVGAPHNGDVGAHAGHTYLFFGKASGWSMDLKPSKADASFHGENAGDYSGYSVAGAGDVNGDGFDDILIGAHQDDDGGNNAGQAYLILGRSLGWSLNTNLSSASASFWGEKVMDYAGYSVAGAGDVNNDGYDDILIGAPEGIYSTGLCAGETYLILGMATGWSMDTNLSLASASFPWGMQIAGGHSGISVEGAGDVNNDGYDDFLIGAWKWCDGQGNRRGMTYLIFGKATGWYMNDRLDRNASFFGEDDTDWAGLTVAGVGDVNGDGYDDFMIGAPWDSDGGTYAGQAYLIFGRSSGWSGRTNLSSANASFLGENKADRAGMSIAGVGDVNRDGYDDIIIGAYQNSDGGDSAGQTYLFLGKATGWSMDTNLSSADASFLGEKTGDEAGFSAAGAGDVNGDGFDDILIGARRNDDEASDAGQVYLVIYDDGGPPVITMDITPDNSTTGDSFTFNVSMSDGGGVKNVTIEYWYGTPYEVFNRTARLTSGDQANGTWALRITVSRDSIDTLHYVVHAADWAFYLTSSNRKDVTVLDDDLPVLVKDLTLSNATTGDVFTFSANVMDNVNLSHVMVVYWYGDNGTGTNLWMAQGPGYIRNRSITIPSDSLKTLHYSFYLEDNSTNNVTSMLSDVNVTDNDPPVFGPDASSSTAKTDHSFTFSIPVEDNLGVAWVWVEYWYGSGIRMEKYLFPTGTVWETWIVIVDRPDDLHYIIWSIDVHDNMGSTRERIMTVIDVTKPNIITEATGRTATTGDPFEFSITASDNVGLKQATVWYAIGDGELTPVEMEVVTVWPSGKVDYSLFIDVPTDAVGNITYRIEVEDIYGNLIKSNKEYVRIVDDDGPTIIEDLTPVVAYIGEPFTFQVIVSDNVGLEVVEVMHTLGDDDPLIMKMASVQGLEGVYHHTIDLPVQATGPLSYRFRLVDLAGNELNGTLCKVPVVDVSPPEILDVIWSLPLKGMDLTVVLHAQDNVGVTGASITYWFGDGPHNSMDMDEHLEAVIGVPRWQEGSLHFVLTVSDAAGYWVTSEEMVVPLVNAPPELTMGLIWEVTEGANCVLDLSDHISDSNDDHEDLLLNCDAQGFTVDGFVLGVRLDRWVPDQIINVSITDGEVDIIAFLTVTMINVNDAPVIFALSPENGTRFKEGEIVTFTVEAMDEDDDGLVITWLSDGKTLGTGTTLDYKKLKLGSHHVKVSISDGMNTTEDSIILVITKDKETPGFGALVTILVILTVWFLTLLDRGCIAQGKR